MGQENGISVCIPYFRRKAQLFPVLEALASQVLGSVQTEIILGVSEHGMDVDIEQASASFGLDVSQAVVEGDWTAAKARNACLRRAVHSVLVFLDADIVLDPSALRGHYDRHQRRDRVRPEVLLGAVLDYDKLANQGSDETFGCSSSPIPDRRTQAAVRESKIPWCMSWTGHLSLLRDEWQSADVWFDEHFVGWGMEDQEFGYRLYQQRFRFEFAPRLLGRHIAHERNVTKNLQEERENLRRFIAKHPCVEVELVAALGDVQANSVVDRYRRLLNEVVFRRRMNPWSPSRTSDWRKVNAAVFSPGSSRLNGGFLTLDPGVSGAEWRKEGASTLPLVGLCTPFEDGRFDVSYLDSEYRGLGAECWALLKQEAHRVSKGVVVSE